MEQWEVRLDEGAAAVAAMAVQIYREAWEKVDVATRFGDQSTEGYSNADAQRVLARCDAILGQLEGVKRREPQVP